MFSIALEWRL